MSRSADIAARVAPWAGLITGPLGWALNQQVGSNMIYARCELGGTGSSLLLGLTGVAVALAGGAWSWTVWRRGPPQEREADAPPRFLASLSLMSAGLFALAILFQTLAGLFLEGCWR